MKLTLVFLIMALMQVSAKTYSQQINLNEKNTHLEKVLHSIEKQTGYVFLYANKGIKEAIVTVHVTNGSIDETLKACFENSAITFKIVNKNILLKLNEPSSPDGTSGSSVLPINIHGTVTDSNDQLPLRGVTIQLVGGTQRAITNENGEFTINVPEKSQLKITMVGYKPLIVTASANMKIRLDVDVKSLSEVTIGYGTQKKDLVSVSVEHVKFTEADNEIPTTMAGNLLAGRMAGVSVSNPNGIPGQSSPDITIRTKSSFSDTKQPALFVIDGKVSASGDFNNLSPNEIDEVTTLKDAAATAAYGARAAGGVILVTTKRGKAGKASVQYSFNTGFDSRVKNIPLTSAIQNGQLINQISPGSTDAWTAEDFAYMKNINNGYGYDQLKIIWRNPYTTTHNLSVSGGSEKLRYFIGGSYVKQEGFMKNLEYDKYNFRANISGDLTKDLSFFAGMSLNNNLTHAASPGVGADYTQDLYSKLLIWQPWQPVYTNAGKIIDYGWIGNVGAETNGEGGYQNISYLKPVINLNLTYKVPFIQGLSANASYIKSYTNSRTKNFAKSYAMNVMKAPTQYRISTDDADIVSTRPSTWDYPGLEELASWAEDKQLNLQLNYERTFNKHHIKGWVVYESAESKGGGMDAEIDGFPVYVTDQWWATSTQVSNQYVSNSRNLADVTIGRRSWVGQAFYDYSEKYLASFTSRYDGSMNFAADKRWGFFPSGSVGWILSKEPFFENVKGIDLLKITASAGLVGNDFLKDGAYLWLDTYQNGASAYFGTTPAANAGITYGSVPNQDFTWEKSFNRNYAVSVDFLKHFSSKVEYWQTHTYDILGQRIQTIPPTFSRTPPPQNYGKADAAGIDVSVNYHTKIGQVDFNTGINASYGNVVTKLKDENITYPYDKSVGRSQSAITAYYTEIGMIRTQDDLNNLLAKNPNYKFNGRAPALGQLIYADISGPNGVPDGIIDNWDKGVLRANNNPINLGWNLSASWKGFSLAATFVGSFRQWKSFNDVTGGVEWNRMWSNWATDSWTPENPNATLPKRYGTNDGTKAVNNEGSNFWYANASFLRLRNLNVAYSVPARWCSKIGIQGVRLYASGSNLFIISGFNKKYYDPEIGNGTAFPITRSFNFGCAVNL
ncbi:SusC/RagA family TonB-linked outer membrane protein [Pedobacter nutrimenti]|uniref:SusC/RagA family TonB-linked outer membrane protein n=1 Tax=Pedobacter nutrimenti TaxID=1241337 RepID=UPI00292ED357|nr:SusC/RagA family TonB-linked outer membrane protein [Pedobacter nutrimenti]